MCRSLASGLTLTSQSTNPVSLRVVFVFLRKKCVFEEEEQKSGFLSPKKKMVRAMSSRVRAVYKSYPKSLTYYMVNDMPRGVSDTYRMSGACPRVQVSDARTLHKVAVYVFHSCKTQILFQKLSGFSGSVGKWQRTRWGRDGLTLLYRNLYDQINLHIHASCLHLALTGT